MMDKLDLASDTEPSADEIKEIILDAMESEDVYPEDVPEEKPFDVNDQHHLRKSCRYFRKHGFGIFDCRDKDWASVFSWCYIDLKEQEICYRYYQKCQTCDGKVLPKYDKGAIKKMAALAVESFLIRTGRKERQESDGNPSRRLDGPHDEANCELCIRLGSRCC